MMGRDRRALVAVMAVTVMQWQPALAQMRDIDAEASVGKVLTGTLSAEAPTSDFRLVLPPGGAVALQVVPDADLAPYIGVYDLAGRLLRETRDGSSGAVAQLVVDGGTGGEYRVQVSQDAPSEADALYSNGGFSLVVAPPAFRPAPIVEADLTGRGDFAAPGTINPRADQLFIFQLEAGTAWQLRLAAADGSTLDPYLQLFSGVDPVGDPLLYDDDGGGGRNALLLFPVSTTGHYAVLASGYAGSGGDFRLTMTTSQDAVAEERVGLQFGRPVTNTLTDEEPERTYELSPELQAELLEANSPFTITMVSSDQGGAGIDPYLEAGFETPLGFSSTQVDDDGAGNLNARLSVSFSTDEMLPTWLSQFRVRAGSFGGTGRFTLTIDRAELSTAVAVTRGD